MTDDLNTPINIEPTSDGVHEWTRYMLVRLNERTKSISKNITDLCVRADAQDKFRSDAEVRLALGAERFANLSSQIDELKRQKKNGNPGTNAITFQWLLEKFAWPIVMLIACSAIALLFKG